VTKVPSDADIVFFPTQKPGDAQTFAQQLLEQGKKAKVFGGDGSNDSSQFKAPGSYVSNFAPDITGIPADAKIIAGWKKDNPGKSVGSFGPPAYGAAQIAMMAIQKACKAGHGTATRVGVLRSVKKVKIDNWILGGQVPLVDEVQRPAERQVLHLPDSVERLVQARRLELST
jgi:ABC-type branched-chain amino acid transport systems, periplasmic component